MAGRGGPTFLKRQKEQKRAARAIAKRAAQQARRDERAAGVKEDDLPGEVISEPLEQATEADAAPGKEPIV